MIPRLQKKWECTYCGEAVWFGTPLRSGGLLCAACRPCVFFEKYLTLTDDFAGQPFKLMPWERQALRDIFGPLDDEGRRIIRDVYLEVAKKNAKSTFVAGLALFLLVGQGRFGQKVYGAATAKEQAGEVFRKAAKMARRSPALSAKVRILDSTTGPKRIIRRDDTESFYVAISADGDFNDGVNPSFVIRDEVHRWRARKALELAEVLERGMITREEPLLVDITTAGEAEDESPLAWRRHEYARQVSEGAFADRHFYGRIWSADLKKHDWRSRQARVQANPSHEDNGGYLKDSVLEALCIKAQNDPIAKRDYLRYNLNVWVRSEEHVIDMDRWTACGGGVDLGSWPLYDVELLVRKWDLIDKPCWAGIDTSWTTDLTALTLLFPPVDESRVWTLLSFSWMPSERVDEIEHRCRVPLSDWIRRGFLATVPGAAMELDPLIARIRWASELFELREVAYDPWNFQETANKLSADYVCVKVPQNFGHLSAPTKRLIEIYSDGRLRHGNNPLVNWAASCLALQYDHKDNVQPTKPERGKSGKRIDPVAAAVTGMHRAMLAEEPAEVGVRST